MLSLRIFFKKEKYFASAFFYSCLGLLFSTWVTYIPHVAEKLHITEGKIGGALFFSALGSFMIIPVCNWLVARLGIGRMTFFALLFLSTAIFGPLLAPNYPCLCIALLFLGMSTGTFVITINTLTATIEKSDNVFIMSGSHGFFSAGAMIGASLGGVLSARLNSPLLHMSIMAAVVLSVQLYFRPSYYRIKGEKASSEKKMHHSLKPLILVAMVGLIVMVSEGAVADWSALYLKNVAKLKLDLLGFGYAGFSLMMALGRFIGDWISHRLSSWKIISMGFACSLAGFALVLQPFGLLSIPGFAIVGLGFSVIVPEVYRIASRTEGIETTAGVSFIAGTANIGFLIGPVMLGFIAELYTLKFSFLALSAFLFMALTISLFMYNKSNGKAEPEEVDEQFTNTI